MSALAATAILHPTPYTINNECPTAWPESASLNVVASYPFLSPPGEENPSDFVVRAYLETLWLPEAIAPLDRLVNTIRRVSSTLTTPNAPSPILELVLPLLLSLRGVSHKYRVTIPQMIEAGGCANPEEADLEESMIVFAWTHEKRDASRVNESGYEEKWTKEWLGRCERRETLVQVLLHFLVLSLPSSDLPHTDNKRKRKDKHTKSKGKQSKSSDGAKGRETAAPDPSKNIYLLMDRLSIWREAESALEGLEDDDGERNRSTLPPVKMKAPGPKDARDWLRVFCDDVVRPAFAKLLPPLFDAFRSRCFPETSPLYSDSDDKEVLPARIIRATSRARSASVARQSSIGPNSASASTATATAELNRALGRERSMSITGTNNNNTSNNGTTTTSVGATSSSGSLGVPGGPGPGRGLNRTASVTATSSASSSVASQRREVTMSTKTSMMPNSGTSNMNMRRSMSVQREESFGPGGDKGKGPGRGMAGSRRPSQSQYSQSQSQLQTQSQSRSLLHPQAALQSQASLTIVPETPIGARSHRSLARATTLGDFRQTGAAAVKRSSRPPSSSGNNDIERGMFEEEEDGDDEDGFDLNLSLRGVGGSMIVDEPEELSSDSQSQSQSYAQLQPRTKQQGRERSNSIVLVEDTPVRARSRSFSRSSYSQPGAGPRSRSNSRSHSRAYDPSSDQETREGSLDFESESGGMMLVPETPAKR